MIHTRNKHSSKGPRAELLNSTQTHPRSCLEDPSVVQPSPWLQGRVEAVVAQASSKSKQQQRESHSLDRHRLCLLRRRSRRSEERVRRRLTSRTKPRMSRGSVESLAVRNVKVVA